MSRGDLKGETDSEIIAEEGQARQTNMKQKYYKQKQMVMQTRSTIL